MVAGQAIDTFVHPAHRKRGVFKALTIRALAEAKQNGYQFIFNFPNENSFPLYLKLGWHFAGRLRRSTKILNIRCLFRIFVNVILELLGRNRGASKAMSFAGKGKNIGGWSDEIGEAVDALSLSQNKLQVKKDSKYLFWRYALNPLRDYNFIPMRSGGKITALGVLSINELKGLKYVSIVDLIYSLDNIDLGVALLSRILYFCKEQNAGVLTLWSTKDGQFNELLKQIGGFLNYPSSNQVFTIKPLSDSPNPDIFDLGNWKITLGDTDTQ
jgi:hypothetical protein